VDERSHPPAGAGEAQGVRGKDRLSGQVARLLHADNHEGLTAQ